MDNGAAIVLAAGRGTRMKSETPKQYLPLGGVPLIVHSLSTFAESPLIQEIVLVATPGEEEYCRREIVERYGITKVKAIVPGGAERYHSVYAGLQAISPDCETVYVHDGARPFVTQEILRRAAEAVARDHACVVGMPVKDTIKISDDDGYAASTPDRSHVWMVQTPQVFEYHLILGAYKALMDQEQELLDRGIRITDDAMTVETFTDTKVRLVEGSYTNIKVTTPEDLPMSEEILKLM